MHRVAVCAGERVNWWLWRDRRRLAMGGETYAPAAKKQAIASADETDGWVCLAAVGHATPFRRGLAPLRSLRRPSDPPVPPPSGVRGALPPGARSVVVCGASHPGPARRPEPSPRAKSAVTNVSADLATNRGVCRGFDRQAPESTEQEFRISTGCPPSCTGRCSPGCRRTLPRTGAARCRLRNTEPQCKPSCTRRRRRRSKAIRCSPRCRRPRARS
jgi:hypothetical protein